MIRITLSLVVLLGMWAWLAPAPCAAATTTTPAATMPATASRPGLPGAGASALGLVQMQARREAVIGTWAGRLGDTRIILHLDRDGSFHLDHTSGHFSLAGDKLVLATDAGTTTYAVQLAAHQLTLSGGDLTAKLVLNRQSRAGDYVVALFDISPAAMLGKLWHILGIIVIALAARLLLLLVRRIITLAIMTDWGVFGLFYVYHKNRAMTINSLALNVIKYVIYLSALGFILGELGIDYTAYIASLSVVGLAIGFGSQDLVRDMVSGFFVIFESQYDVGDMVEISGQVGVVQEIGLRMTRLRNYLGQVVVIPNRNITVVGNFHKGAQQVTLDVAIPPPEASRDVSSPSSQPSAESAQETPAAPQPPADPVKTLRLAGEESAREFDGLILEPPRVEGPIELKTGERYLRLTLAIWPQQTWIIDQGLLPRIRDAFKRANIEIPGDRITVFYHARQAAQVHTHGRLSETLAAPLRKTGESLAKPLRSTARTLRRK